MSFGESVFSARFIQKTVKVDQNVRFNYAYPQRKGHQKTQEDSTPKQRARRRQVGLARAHLSAPHCYVGSPPPPRLHLHRPLSWFDPRAHVGRFGLYILAPATLPGAVLKP